MSRTLACTHRVTLRDDGRHIDLREGEKLLLAAWKGGVGIKSVCGGRGRCGSCVVQIDETAPGALREPSAIERELLPPHPTGGIYRLACLCEVHGDTTISVPPESQAVRSAPRKPYTVGAVATRPLVSRVRFTIEPADAPSPRSLDERIAEGAERVLDRKQVELPLPVVAEFASQPDFDTELELTATVTTARRIVQVVAGRRERCCGIAVDVGTTSFVIFLSDLASGEILAMRTGGNPQAAYGEDVISRIAAIQQDSTLLAAMHGTLLDALNRLTSEACVEAGIGLDDVVDAVLVGNPTMQHILLGLNPETLGRAPYPPVWSGGVELSARELGLAIASHAPACVFPMVSGFIGGDTIAALLTRDAEFRRGTQLLVDVGTNGEVVLSHRGELMATSCATGPVYEGAHIRCGMRAAPGAIERVRVRPDGAIRWTVIGDGTEARDKRPIGLCGSGVISAVCAGVRAGLIGRDGALARPQAHPQLRASRHGGSEELVLVPNVYSRTGRDIVLTQQDVRAVQLGKSALRTGIEILLAECGVKSIDRILLAGTFGNYLEPEDIVEIGMVPPLPVERIRSIGNAAGDGARMALLDRHCRRRASALARRLAVLELSGRAEFQDLFVMHTALSASGASRTRDE
ncbi:MAG: DUF4445 domain-containing protein [Burkholderiaceae bacterium]|nr:DUF4445 domain-containing protein [Burkholderiaceae bacterium]